MPLEVPSFLKGYEETWAASPRAACLRWFREARFGLFMHYGLYSLLGRGEWVQLLENIPVGEYARLMDDFTAARFDAGFYAALARDAGMKYVNLTTRHHDSFCLWNTKQTEFNSARAPNCGRDLVGELAEACDQHRLGLCLYYSHGRDWRHPHAPNNDRFAGRARPEYDPPAPEYATGADHDLNRYVDFMSAQITELLTGYGPIAAIWLDGIGVPLPPKRADGTVISDYDPRRDGDPFRCQELYDLVHSLQPQALVSYKQGYLHTEDFYAPERHVTFDRGGKPAEVCDTLMPQVWGHDARSDGQHKTADQVWEALRVAGRVPANLLLNTGPLPDGAIHPEDEPVLREVGARLRAQGFPA